MNIAEMTEHQKVELIATDLRGWHEETRTCSHDGGFDIQVWVDSEGCDICCIDAFNPYVQTREGKADCAEAWAKFSSTRYTTVTYCAMQFVRARRVRSGGGTESINTDMDEQAAKMDCVVKALLAEKEEQTPPTEEGETAPTEVAMPDPRSNINKDIANPIESQHPELISLQGEWRVTVMGGRAARAANLLGDHKFIAGDMGFNRIRGKEWGWFKVEQGDNCLILNYDDPRNSKGLRLVRDMIVLMQGGWSGGLFLNKVWQCDFHLNRG